MASVRTGMGTVFGALLLFAVGCGGNPLDGTWAATNTSQGITTKEAFDLKDDATATVSLSITNTPQGITCKGSIEYSGYDWSSTDTKITVSGSAKCTTSLVCMAAGQNLPVNCSPTSNVAGTCDYKLSSDENTLDVSNCTNKGMNGTVSFTREQ